MTDEIPEPSAEPAPRRKPAARKPAARKPARKSTGAAKGTAAASEAGEPTQEQTAVIETPPVAHEEPAPRETVPPSVPPRGPVTAEVPTVSADGSVLGSLRANRMGALMAGLVVALGVGLLLSVLVPSEPQVLALLILGALLSAAVGFTVRYLSSCRGLRTQAAAFITAGLGVHLMTVTGSVGGDLPSLPGIGGGSIGLNESLLAALAVPPFSAGVVLAGLTAAIIAGWGVRTGSQHP